MKCEVSADLYSLKFSFEEIIAPELTDILFTFTNFINPWSAVTVSSISIKSYANSECNDPAASSLALDSRKFYAVAIPEAKVSVTSTSNIIGDSDAANTATFKFTPTKTLSRDGRGSLDIGIPKWYE